ncbi:MAG: PKD domain-containing protein [Methanosarcina flavescens]|jgi:hypothetical protein|uniref:PKD domain-containing protein n=1 Tax=Methanosarcina flavescens TaxID=1715806 RepID=A0A7K4AYI9_9EURY|nr:PKD domain-containing protein [Methanosarcina flavescens]
MKLKNGLLICLISFIAAIGIASATPVECLNNSKHIAVYLENAQTVSHDPFCTSMFYEYNLTYLFNDTILSQDLSGIDLLIVPENQMSNSTAAIINDYLNNGGKVWFLNDPIFDENGNLQTTNRINILGNWSQYPINHAQRVYFNNTDPLLSGFPSSLRIQSSIESYTWMRAYSPRSGTISGFRYNVLMHQEYWDGNMLVKFENTTTGAKAIYSNPNMFISGGKTSYFDSNTASTLFYSLRDWILGFESNTYSVAVTYPKTDKILTLTIDDIHGSDNEIQTTSSYFRMKKNLAYSVPDTFFIIPDSDTTKKGLNYLSQFGDTHTIHPHGVDWTDVNTASSSNVTMFEDIINDATGKEDYGFYSFRFPGTTGTIPAFQIFADLGYSISSNYGPFTGMGSIGDELSNNMFFPKQKILYNKKTNLIELETPTRYDINTDTPADIYTDNINSLQYFKNINFPANYIIGGHIQGVMENPDMVSNISKVFVYTTQNLDDVSYESLETIAKYNSGIKNSTIIATRNDNNTSIEITTQQPISNFTIKLINNRNLITADYDGAEIYEDKIRYKNGFYYIYHDVDPGTHTINITDTGVPVHSFSMSSDSGVAPLTVAFNDTSIIKSENLSWDFENDGIVDSTEKNPVHVFEKVGVYSINMTVSSSDGSFSCIKTVTVNPFTSDVLNKLYWFLYKHLSKFLPTSILT